MSTRARVVAPFALASALVLGLSGCSVLEDWGVLNSADSVEEAPDATGEAGADTSTRRQPARLKPRPRWSKRASPSPPATPCIPLI